jgi:hypothetical protein
VTGRGLAAVGDDHLVGDEVVLVEDLDDPRLDPFRGQRLAVEGQRAVGDLC